MACRISNTLVGIFNIIAILLSLGAIGWSLYLFLYSNTTCQKTMQYPLLIIGIVLFVVSLLGAIGSCGRLNFFLYLYLFLMFLSIVGLICITVFVFLVTNETAGKTLSRVKLGDYPNWMKNHVIDGQKWDQIKGCLLESHACSNLGGSLQNVDQFYKKKLSILQSGCCKPPSACGLEFKNATYWTMPKTGPAVADSDCTTWSNNQNALCFDCNACKEGFLTNIKHEWRNLTAFSICATVLLIVIYSFGCCAIKNNSKDARYNRYRGHFA